MAYGWPCLETLCSGGIAYIYVWCVCQPVHVGRRVKSFQKEHAGCFDLETDHV